MYNITLIYAVAMHVMIGIPSFFPATPGISSDVCVAKIHKNDRLPQPRNKNKS